MTFFRRLTISRPWHYWSWIPPVIFILLWIQGSLLDLTDDEAYYWVLAQKPSLGYAYHPPAVAWFIAGAQWALGWLFGSASSALVRLPAALSTAVFFGLTLRWLHRSGVPGNRLFSASLVLFSFAGFFALSWMMVPDSPLFLGWTIAFTAAWSICFSEFSLLNYPALALGVALAILSKYSGVQVFICAVAAILIWAPAQRKWKALLFAFLGLIVGSVPILIWNSEHHWASVLYQFSERQGHPSFSGSRYLRFWLIELIAAGPVVVVYTLKLIFGSFKNSRLTKYIAVWTFPPAIVYLLQPAFAEFKPHWAFIVWWPGAILLAWEFALKGTMRGSVHLSWAKIQVAYGFILTILVLISCHYPLLETLKSGSDPKWDVTNDLYGWSELKSFLTAHGGADAQSIPVVGVRYQTAAQAAFALGEYGRATFLPRDEKAMDEWPNVHVSSTEGPDWPTLKAPLFFVADNRYSDGPGYLGAECLKVGRIEKKRRSYMAKWIDVWKCVPSASSAKP